MTEWTPEEERVARALEPDVWFNRENAFACWNGAADDVADEVVRPSIEQAKRAIAAMQPRWRDVATDPPPPNVSLLLFEPETPGRAGAIVVGMARWGWDNEVASNWSENPWATHWTPLPPAPEDKP